MIQRDNLSVPTRASRRYTPAMRGFVTSLLADRSLLTGTLAVLGTALLAVGIVLLLRGLTGRYRNNRPSCRACGFDLSCSPRPATANPAPVAPRGFSTLADFFVPHCPECGTDLSPPGAILAGQRERRWFAMLAGVVLIILGATPTSWVANQSFAQVNWTRYRTQSALLSAMAAGSRAAGDELQYRTAVGNATPEFTAQVLKLFKSALNQAHDGIAPAPPAAKLVAELAAMDGLLSTLASGGHISAAQYTDLLPIAAPPDEWTVKLKPVNRATPWLSVELAAPAMPIGTLFGQKFQAQIRLVKAVVTDADGQEQDVSTMGGAAWFYPQSGGGGSAQLRQRLKAGNYTLKLEFRRVFGGHTPPLEDSFTAQAPLRVLADRDIAINVLTDRETGQQIVDRLKIHEIGIVTGYAGEKQVRLLFSAAGIPSDWSFTAVIRQGERKYTLGPTSVEMEAPGTMSVQTSNNLLFGSLAGFTDEPVDLILMPGGRKHAWNKEKVNLWQGTITIPGLKVAKPRAYDDWPQGQNMPLTPFDRSKVIVETESEKPPDLPPADPN